MHWQMWLFDRLSRFVSKGGALLVVLVVFIVVAIIVAGVGGGSGGAERSSRSGTSESSFDVENARPSAPTPSTSPQTSTPTRSTSGNTPTSYGYIRNRDGAKHYRSLSACINHNMSPAEHAGAESNASTIAYCEELNKRGFVQ